jgi:hypothetical protein
LLQRAVEQFNKDFADAPVLWILIGLLVMAQLGSWQAGGQLDRVCALTDDHDIEQAATAVVREELDNICLNHRAER